MGLSRRRHLRNQFNAVLEDVLESSEIGSTASADDPCNDRVRQPAEPTADEAVRLRDDRRAAAVRGWLGMHAVSIRCS